MGEGKPGHLAIYCLWLATQALWILCASVSQSVGEGQLYFVCKGWGKKKIFRQKWCLVVYAAMTVPGRYAWAGGRADRRFRAVLKLLCLPGGTELPGRCRLLLVLVPLRAEAELSALPRATWAALPGPALAGPALSASALCEAAPSTAAPWDILCCFCLTAPCSLRMRLPGSAGAINRS